MALKWCMLLIALAAGECLEHKEGDLFLGAETRTQRLQNAEQEAFFFFLNVQCMHKVYRVFGASQQNSQTINEGDTSQTSIR